MMNSSKVQSPMQALTNRAHLMPFGAHKGTPLDQLPSDYLLWLGCLNDLRQPLLGHVLKEMARRLMELERQPEKRESVHG
jgi:uncharacterized protein (DUF3820 family)